MSCSDSAGYVVLDLSTCWPTMLGVNNNLITYESNLKLCNRKKFFSACFAMRMARIRPRQRRGFLSLHRSKVRLANYGEGSVKNNGLRRFPTILDSILLNAAA